MSEGILPEYCSICGGVAGPHAREKVIALNIVGHRAHVCPGYHDSHPPHKYCQKCEQWRDLDGMDCGRCGTTLVLRRLDEHSEPALKHDGNLGDGDRVYYRHYPDGSTGIRITGGEYVTPEQTLSLLAWLQQEKPELERLAKEQEQ